jgi:hypothetical protein
MNTSALRALVFSSLVVMPAAGTIGCNKLMSSVGLGGGDASVAPEAPNVLSGFEGDMGIRIKPPEGKPPVDVMLQIKGDRVRVALPASLAREAGQLGMSDGYMLLQTKDKRAYFVSDKAKKAIVVDFEKAKEQVEQMTGHQQKTPSVGAPAQGENASTSTRIKIVRTGKTSTVAGFACEEWDIGDTTKPLDKATACVASQGASWLALPTKLLPDEAAFASELLDGKHVPLRVAITQNSKQTMSIEATKIEKKTLADSLFDVPAGYETVDVMTAVMGMMGAMGGGLLSGSGAGGGRDVRVPPSFHPPVQGGKPTPPAQRQAPHSASGF